MIHFSKLEYLPENSVWPCRRYHKNRRQSPDVKKFYNLTKEIKYAGMETSQNLKVIYNLMTDHDNTHSMCTLLPISKLEKAERTTYRQP